MQPNVPFDGISRLLNVKGNVDVLSLDGQGKINFNAKDLSLIPTRYGSSVSTGNLAAGTNVFSYAYLNPVYIWNCYSLEVAHTGAALTRAAFVQDYAANQVSSLLSGTVSNVLPLNTLSIVIPPLFRLAIVYYSAVGTEVYTIRNYHQYDEINVRIPR